MSKRPFFFSGGNNQVENIAKITFADSYRELQDVCEELNPGEPTVFLGGLVVNRRPEE